MFSCPTLLPDILPMTRWALVVILAVPAVAFRAPHVPRLGFRPMIHLSAHPGDETMIVDLRSDTVTKPTAAMREAMAAAEVGDDVMGDDPTVKILEEKTAELFGKEAALFVPTGTQGNLISVMAQTWERGSEYIVGDKAHIYIFEQGGGATLGGAHPRAVTTGDDGRLDLDTVAACLRADDPHFPVTKLLCLENTHNLCGGRVLAPDYMAAAGEVARAMGAALHVDGARIWHAAHALGTTLQDLSGPADSLSVCLSKVSHAYMPTFCGFFGNGVSHTMWPSGTSQPQKHAKKPMPASVPCFPAAAAT